MSDEIVWEDPPGHKRQPAKCPASELQIKEMQENPGKWMRIKDFEAKNAASPAATRIRNGGYEALSPAEDWEVTTRQVGETSALWMRYRPEATE